jgi:hypothetical protein
LVARDARSYTGTAARLAIAAVFGRARCALVWFSVPDVRKIEGAGDGRDEARI